MSQIKSGAILSYVSIGVTNIIGLILTPFIVKSLGDSEYGLYSLIGALVGYLTVMDLGLNNTIVRYVSKYRAEKDEEGERRFLGATIIVYLIISLIVFLLGLLLYFNLENLFSATLTEVELGKAKLMVIILIFNLMISLPGGSFTAICNAYENFVFPRALTLINYLIRSILVYVILKFGADSIGLVILDTIVNIAAILISMSYVLRRMKVSFSFKKVNMKIFYNIFSYSVWIFLFAIIGQLQWKGGQFVIGTTLDTTSVGIYAIGIVLGTYYGAFSAAISSLFLPRATQMFVNQSSSEELTDMMVKIARFSLFSLLFIFVGFFVFGKEFIVLWLNNTYNDAYYVALLIMLGYTLPLIQTFANSIIEAQKLFRFKALVYLATLGLGTGLSFFVVKEYGIISVIICVVSFWLLAQGIMNVFFYKVLKLNMMRFFLKVSKGLIFVFIIMIFAGYVVNYFITNVSWFYLFIKIFILTSIYIPLLFVLGMNKEEQIYIKSIIKRK